MHKTTDTPANAPAASPANPAPQHAGAARLPDVRSLADWELLMVGGGETTPDW